MNKTASKSILAIETCSETCSVAVSHKGKSHQIISIEPRGHADNILPLVDKVLNEANLQLNICIHRMITLDYCLRHHDVLVGSCMHTSDLYQH